jgi:2-polyprenyl-6-hydroxyphenyl methylase/3-demethylubiquinone-9 3-methyltransferase
MNYDQDELNKFTAHASHWWDPEGELKTLHQVNPVRLGYITNKSSIAGKKIIDIGCGGGILSESMATLGANVTGIDMSPGVIEVAKLHLLESTLNVNYVTTSAEKMAEEQAGQFDIVTCMEMLEHVPSPDEIVKACAQLVKPGGQVFFSTLNRNPKSYLFAILAAEYMLRLLPRNTHDYAKFIRPSELASWCREAGLAPREMKGIHYNPFTKQFKVNDDTSVNYLFYATKL